MKKKENWIKNLIWIIALISIITQVNIFLDYSVLKTIEKRKNEQLIKCPPDICIINDNFNLELIPEGYLQ